MKVFCSNCQKIFAVDTAEKAAPCPACQEEIPVPAEKVAPGVVLGDFLIEKLISVGGMGAVYVARQLSLDREVALKVLLENLSSDPEYVNNLLYEARAAAKLNHPNIVQVYAVGEENGIYYFAMEYVRGDTFKHILVQKKVLQPLEAAKIVYDVAKALDAAWKAQKIVHQDIKPENIMLDANGFAKLADLGLARKAGSDTGDSDEVMGTPQYISPEQLTGCPVDIRSDIYSLGATFYHFVTGRFPFPGKDATEIGELHLKGNLTPPVEIAPALPGEVNNIILKMMARDIDKRYQTPEELIAALEHYINTEISETTMRIKIFNRKKKRIDNWKKFLRCLCRILPVAAAVAIIALITSFFVGKSDKAPVFCQKIYNAVNPYLPSVPREPARIETPQTKPAPPPRPVSRESLLTEAGELLMSIENGTSPETLLPKCIRFFNQYPIPQSDEEMAEMQKVQTAFAETVEKQCFEPFRARHTAALLAKSNAAKDKRAAMLKEREAEKRRLKAEKEAKDAELRRQQDASDRRAAVYSRQCTAAGKKLWEAFLASVSGKLNNGFTAAMQYQLPPPPDDNPVAVNASKKYAELKQEIIKLGNDISDLKIRFRNIASLNILVPVNGRMSQVVSASLDGTLQMQDFDNNKFTITGKTHPAEFKKFINTLSKTLTVKGAPPYPVKFYLQILAGKVEKNAAPAGFWRDFLQMLSK